MSYEYTRWRKDKSSIIPIEETYTDLDINNNDENVPTIGYRFDSPRRWCTDSSSTKSVGIRDLHLIPSSGDIRCKFLTYANTSITGRRYDWTATNPDDSDDEDWIPRYRPTLNSVRFSHGLCQCVSSDYNIQITPENNFEEIMTDMMNFINDASWKSIAYNTQTNEYELLAPSEHDTTKNLYYRKETTDSNGDTGYDSLNYVYNSNYLKQPITFYYEYDANLCNFNIKAYDDLRYMLMTNRSKSDNDLVTHVARVYRYTDGINDSYIYRNYRGLDYAQKLTHTVSGSTVDYDSIYVGNGIINIEGYELLMVIKLEDTNSIKAAYDLFNQPMPDISTLPVINLEDGLYVIPFKDNTFHSHFCYGTGTNKTTFRDTFVDPADFTYEIRFIETNLKLNNVWDRIHLIYHASFAETRHRIIGRNGDHWDTPNKQFIVPGGDQEQFYIRFTTDGIHHILPIGCHFNLDLCFMLNPTKNTATGIRGNHDSFKD